jgi:hypothetical protein
MAYLLLHLLDLELAVAQLAVIYSIAVVTVLLRDDVLYLSYERLAG